MKLAAVLVTAFLLLMFESPILSARLNQGNARTEVNAKLVQSWGVQTLRIATEIVGDSEIVVVQLLGSDASDLGIFRRTRKGGTGPLSPLEVVRLQWRGESLQLETNRTEQTFTVLLNDRLVGRMAIVSEGQRPTTPSEIIKAIREKNNLWKIAAAVEQDLEQQPQIQ